jgi:hypothetical protein
MATLNQSELQTLRELIGAHDMAARKLSGYSQDAQDSQVKQMFEQSAQSAENTVQKLMSFL